MNAGLGEEAVELLALSLALSIHFFLRSICDPSSREARMMSRGDIDR